MKKAIIIGIALLGALLIWNLIVKYNRIEIEKPVIEKPAEVKKKIRFDIYSY